MFWSVLLIQPCAVAVAARYLKPLFYLQVTWKLDGATVRADRVVVERYIRFVFVYQRVH